MSWSPARRAALVAGVSGLALAATAGFAARQDSKVVAVLTSDSGQYRAEWAAFLKAFGRAVAVSSLVSGEPPLGPETSVVVAFGPKAALRPYPAKAAVVYCLAPGVERRAQGRRPVVRIQSLPPPEVLAARLKALQPGLRRLQVFRASDAFGPYVEDLARRARALDLEVSASKLAGSQSLPEALRALAVKPDALWLPPDPALVTEESLATLKGYSWGNRVPLYAPSAVLVEKGAVAAIVPEAGAAGRAAAEAARKLLAGAAAPEEVYPEEVALTVSLSAARRAGLELRPEVLGSARRVLP